MQNRMQSVLAVLGLAAAMGGCAAVNTESEVREDVRTTGGGNPAELPVRTVTTMTPALRCLQDQLAAFRAATASYGLGEINDSTGVVSVGARQMFAIAFGEMNASDGLISLTIPPYSAIGISGRNFPAINIRPDTFASTQYIINGTISATDKQLAERQVDGGISFDRSAAGASQLARAKVISLDMYTVFSKSNIQIPGGNSSNSITLVDAGEGADARLGFDKFGISYETTTTKKESEGRAVRLLLELAAIELVGKTLHIPYWKCFQGTADGAVAKKEVEYLSDRWFARLANTNGVGIWTANTLSAKGYLQSRSYANEGAILPEDGTATARITAIRAALADLGLDPYISNPRDIFMSLLNAPLTTRSPIPIRSLVVDHRLEYRAGDTFDFTVQPDAGAYVSCFIHEVESGRVVRFFPNEFQPDHLASPDQPVRIPDTDRIVLRAKPEIDGKSEEVLCVATTEPVRRIKSPAFETPALEKLPYEDIPALASAISAGAGQYFAGAYRFFIRTRQGK